MSKHLLEALAAFSHMSLVQSMDCTTCEPFSGTLNIHVMDKDEEGNNTSFVSSRYVKVSDSKGNSQIHEVEMRGGEGHLTLSNVEAVQLVVVQVDVQGNQLVNGDACMVSYEINGALMQEDYASHTFHQGNPNQNLLIINQKKTQTTLTITKVLCNQFHERMEFDDTMNFIVHIEGMGCCKTIELTMCNHFQTTLQLPDGNYVLWEEEDPCYQTHFALDAQKPTCCGEFVLSQGEHIVQVINQKRSLSVLTLDKYIRNGNQELIKPQDDACFQVRIIGDFVDEIVELNANNDFALDVCDLPNGYYDIQEMHSDCFDVSYLVNAERESAYAHVEIRECQSASVLIINSAFACSNQHSPLRICKFIRRSDDCLVKPDPCLSFKVMLIGCGNCETFNLNASNNFCVDIEHICCGEYEVREVEMCDFVASYIVNDNCETTSACFCVHEGVQNTIQIINEERNQGEVSICKVMRDACGDFVKPDKSQRFLVTLRSYFCRETFVLDASNDFCVHVCNLREGSYEVKERRCDGFETTYQIKQEEERKKARFLVSNGCCSDIKIINTPCREQTGNLRICKYIANDYGDYVKPSADEEFEVQVQGPCMDTCYHLRAANNWCVILEGLKKGVYRVIEEEANAYTSQYFVNGCESEDALVCIEACNQEVQIVNTRRSYGNLKLSAMIQTCDDCMMKPRSSEHFEILIESTCDTRCITLDASNNFCVLLEDMEKGRYRITQKDNYGYKVLYDVDGMVQSNAQIMMEGCNVNVGIINQMMNCSGIVRVRKWMETMHGDIVLPCDEDHFSFQLTSRCFQNEYTLNKRNNFCVFFDDLEEDAYEICEQEQAGMETYYRINQEICDCGRFTLGRDDIEVDIINKVLPLPTLCVKKRILEDGCLVKPEPCESFEFLLKGRDMHEVYCLCEDNDWCVCIEGLCNQHYEIQELGVDCHITYEIQEQRCKEGYFLFASQDMEIIIINQEVCEPVVTMRKWISDDDGCRVRPCRDDYFEIILEGENYKQCFTLHEGNDWCIQIEGLCAGCYRVHERGCGYRASILVDDCICEDGSFQLQEKDVMIDIINQEGCANALNLYAYEFIDGEEMTPSEEKCYMVEIHAGKQKETFQLDCKNDWCISLVDIQAGRYRIFVKDNPNMIYDVDGECFEQAVDVDMDCGDQCVKLLDVTCPKRDITIRKQMNEQSTSCRMEDACYEIVLRGECSECITLDRSNQWCVTFEDMPPGIYEVKEVSGRKNILYQIDATTPCERGYFTLENKPICITILEKENACVNHGTLNVCTMIKNCDGDLECPPQNACFEVMLDGDEVREDFTLHTQNNFTMNCKNLPFGKYQLQQLTHADYNRIMYRIQGVEQATGEVTFANDGQEVEIINYMNCAKGSIRIMKYIKDASCGCLKRPCKEDAFTIEIKGDTFEQSVILNAANKWCYVFDQLLDGTYTIQEMGMEQSVTYIVNGGKETSSAIVHLQGDDANVKIINASSEQSKGSIEISNVIRNENGYDVQPNEEDRYWVNITKEDENHRVLLHSANHFIVEVRGLEDGRYEVVEEDNQDVLYSVNGGTEQNRAIVQVQRNANQVSVINRMYSKGEIVLHKRVQQSDGSLSQPTGQENYRIHISKPGFNTIVTLNAQNNYTLTLRDLENGMYVVDELDHDDVTYIIDRGNQVDRAIVNVHHNRSDVQVINREVVTKGSIQLIKYMRGSDGQLIRPNATSSYQFQVSKPGFNQLYTLNYENDWMVGIDDLEDGNYVINEIAGGDQVSYIINKGSETDFGIVSVQGNANNVQIINALTNTNRGSILVSKRIRDVAGNLIPPTNTFVYSFYISKPNYREIYTLNANNNWGVLVSNLEDGDYVISEVNPEAQVSYIVNGGSETNRAVIPVRGDENDVVIVNAKPNHALGSITVTKYVRDDSQDLVRPTGDFAVRVQLLKTGYNEVVTLDFTNQWTYTFDNLAEGDYVMNEVNSPYGTSWIIDGLPEVRYALIMVRGDDHQADMINTIRRGEGSITIQKFIRNMEGALVPPPADAQYLFYISKPGFSQSVILTARNFFKVTLPNLEDGNYVISEAAGETNVSYRINGGSETNFAIVNVIANDNLVEAINASRPSGEGSITITKYIRNASGALVRPTGLFQARVHVSKSGFNDVFTLNALNDWNIVIADLMDGEYVLNEVDSEDEVSWSINGGSEVRFASVAVVQNDNQVDMINTPRNGMGSILLSKYIRNAAGQLVRPSANEVFMVQVVGSQTRFLTLDRSNQWNARVSGLTQGTYDVREISNTNYDISYIVNDGVESANAIVNINQNEVSVGILNSPAGSRGVLDIRKYIKNANGTLETPADGDMYQVEIRGANSQQVVELNNDNNFAIRIANLAEGSYTITELASQGFRVTYRVNGGAESDTATIQAGQGQSNLVEIINERNENRNTLDVFKFILDAEGNFQKPLNNQVFRFLLSGTNFQQYFTLSSVNDWHVFIDTLDSGAYEVIEQSNRLYDVRYLVNGGEFQEDGTFQANPGSQNIVEIINQPARSELASLTLEKKIRTTQGDLIIPGNGEVFEIRLTNEEQNFDQTFPLNEANGYLLTIQDLVFGRYTIQEVPQANYRVSYIVNDGDEQASAMVNLQTLDPQNVMIINTVQEILVNAKRTSDIKIILE